MVWQLLGEEAGAAHSGATGASYAMLSPGSCEQQLGEGSTPWQHKAQPEAGLPGNQPASREPLQRFLFPIARVVFVLFFHHRDFPQLSPHLREELAHRCVWTQRGPSKEEATLLLIFQLGTQF